MAAGHFLEASVLARAYEQTRMECPSCDRERVLHDSILLLAEPAVRSSMRHVARVRGASEF